jgi:hypothetical protein
MHTASPLHPTNKENSKVKHYVPANVDEAFAHLRSHIANVTQGSFNMERFEFISGRDVVPSSKVAIANGVAGAEIYAIAIAYVDPDRDDKNGVLGEYLYAAYAYTLTLDGRFVEGLPGDVVSFACRDRAGARVHRHQIFEWLDNKWYITKTSWKKTPRDYRDVKDGQRRSLANGGGRGTLLVPVTLLKDGEYPPPVSPLPIERTA